MILLKKPVTILLCHIKGKHVSDETISASIIQLSNIGCIIECNNKLQAFSNIKLSLFDDGNILITQNLYAKVEKNYSDKPEHYKINFTSIPSNLRVFFNNIMKKK